MKWTMFIVFIGASILGIYLMTFGLPDKPVDEAAELPPGVSLLKIQATDYSFDQEEYRVKQGETVKLVLNNRNGVHGIKIPNLNIVLDPTAGMEQEVEFTEAGTYTIECSIPCGEGHTTMVSTLVVEAA